MDEQPVGWLVTDPEGNVVASGPLIELEMATEIGGSEEGAGDGSD